VSVTLKLLHHSNKQFIKNLYQYDACGWGFSAFNKSICYW